MQALEETTEAVPVGALLRILADVQVIIPDLETPYYKFPNPDHSQVFQLGDKSASAILAKSQQQFDLVQHDIKGLEKIIYRMDDLLQQLVKKKNSIIQSMNVYRRHISALWRLPVETLSQIFVACLPAKTREFRVSVELAPILLTRICRRWREVAVNTPHLWCTLLVVSDTYNPLRRSLWYDLWLKRSQGRSLSLAIHCFYSPTNPTTWLQSLLRPYATHIASLQLLLSSNDVAPEDLHQGLLALQELTIQWEGDYDVTDITRWISRLPRTLHTLKFQGDTAADSFPTISTPNLSEVWAQLRNIEITVKHPYYLVHALRLCPNLSSFKIVVMMLDSDAQLLEPLEPLTHENLQSLFIRGSSWLISISDALNALTLPDLRDFQVNHIWLTTEELKALVARSNCPLELS